MPKVEEQKDANGKVISRRKVKLSEKEIQDAVTAFCSSGIVNVEDATYYDPAAKMFFHVYTDGNYYHGYEVRYPRLSPKEVIQSHIRVHFSLNSFIDACQAGKIRCW